MEKVLYQKLQVMNKIQPRNHQLTITSESFQQIPNSKQYFAVAIFAWATLIFFSISRISLPPLPKIGK